MAEVEIPPEVIKALESFVHKQCLQLHVMERLLGTPERGKTVADFMRDVCGKFLKFNLAERALIVQFITDTHIAVHAAMVTVGKAKPLDSYKEELQRLLATSAEMAKQAYNERGE